MPCGLALRAIQLGKPEAKTKGLHSPLAMAYAISGFRALIVYPANPVHPVKDSCFF
jgi:hypothetical protein